MSKNFDFDLTAIMPSGGDCQRWAVFTVYPHYTDLGDVLLPGDLAFTGKTNRKGFGLLRDQASDVGALFEVSDDFAWVTLEGRITQVYIPLYKGGLGREHCREALRLSWCAFVRARARREDSIQPKDKPGKVTECEHAALNLYRASDPRGLVIEGGIGLAANIARHLRGDKKS